MFTYRDSAAVATAAEVIEVKLENEDELNVNDISERAFLQGSSSLQQQIPDSKKHIVTGLVTLANCDTAHHHCIASPSTALKSNRSETRVDPPQGGKHQLACNSLQKRLSYDINFDGAMQRRKMFESNARGDIFYPSQMNATSATFFENEAIPSKHSLNLDVEGGNQSSSIMRISKEGLLDCSRERLQVQKQTSVLLKNDEISIKFIEQQPNLSLGVNANEDTKIRDDDMIEPKYPMTLKKKRTDGIYLQITKKAHLKRGSSELVQGSYIQASGGDCVEESIHHQSQNFQLNQMDDTTATARFTNFFIIFAYIKRFVRSLIMRQTYRDFNALQQKHFLMIGDAASSYKQVTQETSDRQNLKKFYLLPSEGKPSIIFGKNRHSRHKFRFVPSLKWFLNQFKRVWKSFYECKVFTTLFRDHIFLPDSFALILWDFIILLTIVLHQIVLPIKIFFFLDINSTLFNMIAYFIPFVLFTIDLIIGFNTGIFEFGVIVTDRKHIYRAYWKHQFLLHLVLNLQLLLSYKTDSIYGNYLFCCYLKMQILQRTTKVNQHFQITFKFPQLSELLQLMALVLFITHICGCGFHYVGNLSLQLGETKSWILTENIQSEDWLFRYTISVYFAIVTMVTIGYGDIVPMNVYEKIYVMLMILFSCGIFAYCINTIGTIFQEHNMKYKAFRQKIFAIQEYLESRSINKETQTRVFKQLEYLNEESDEILTKGQSILSECSQDLRQEIQKDYFGKILQRLHILQDNFSKEFISTLSTKMTEKRFGPGEVIVQQDNQLKYIYFIQKGSIEYFVNGSGVKKIPICSQQVDFLNNVVCWLVLNPNLSQKSCLVIDFRFFISEINCSYSVRSLQTTTAAYFSLEEFLTTLKEFPLDYEKYCMIRNQFLLQRRFESSCYSCNQFGHDLTTCPQIHYSINLPVFTKRIFFSVTQIRDVHPVNKRRQKMSALVNVANTKNALKFIRWVYAQTKFEEYADINVFVEAKEVERDKDFFFRCPKIRNNFWSTEQEIVEGISPIQLEKDTTTTTSEEEEEDSYYQTDEVESRIIRNTIKPNSSFLIPSETKGEIQQLQQQQYLLNTIPEVFTQSNGIYKGVQQTTNLLCEESKSKNGQPTQIEGFQVRRDKKIPTLIGNSYSQFLEIDEMLQMPILQQLQDQQQSSCQKSSIPEGKFPRQATASLLKSKWIKRCRSGSLSGCHNDDLNKIMHEVSDIINKTHNVSRNDSLMKRSLESPRTRILSKYETKFGANVSSGRSEQRQYQLTDILRLIQEENVHSVPLAKDGGNYYNGVGGKHENHIFGAMKFTFDFMKEFTIFYPNYNLSNVIKNFKKTWQRLNVHSRSRKTQFSGSPTNSPIAMHFIKSPKVVGLTKFRKRSHMESQLSD